MNHGKGISRLILFAALLATRAAASDSPTPAAERTPRTDLYGDPLPPGVVARLGMARGRDVQHPEEDLTFSADGKQLITCGCDGQVRVWDAATGELRRCQRLSWKPRKDEEQFAVAALAPGGAKVAACDRQHIYQFDTATGKELGRLPGGKSFPDDWLLNFSPNGKLLVVQRYDKDAGGAFGYSQLLWDVAGSNDPRSSKTLDGGFLKCSAFTPDGKHLAGMSEGAAGIVVEVWDTANGKRLRQNNNSFPDEQLSPQSLVFSPDGKSLVVGTSLPVFVSMDRLFLMDALTLRKKATLRAPDLKAFLYLSVPLFSPDGRTLAALCRIAPLEARVLLWDVATSKFLRMLPGMVSEKSKLAFSPDGKTLAGFGPWRHEIRLWDMASGRLRNPRPAHEGTVRGLAVSPDGKWIASGGRELRLWDARTSKTLHVMETARAEMKKALWMPIADEESIRHCLFSPDGKRVISVSGTSVIQMWDVAAGTELRRFAAKRRFRYVYALGMSADGKRLIVTAEEDADYDEGIRLYAWDVETGRLLSQRRYRVEVVAPGNGVPNYLVDRSAFAPDGERLSVWLGVEEASTGDLVATLPKGLGRRMVFSPDGRLLAATLVQPNKRRYEEKGLSLLETASGEELFRREIGEIEHVAFTVDGRGVVVIDKNENLRVWDTFTGKDLYQISLRVQWPGREVPPGPVYSLALLPDGRAVTGTLGGDVFVWDLQASIWPLRKPVGELNRKALDALWSDLGTDAGKAHGAIFRLAGAPAQSAAFLKDHLRPTTVDGKRIEQLLADLDSDSFETRETASKELARMRYRADPMLHRALDSKPSLEMRLRIETILAEPKCPPGEALRTLRAIAVLERIGTPEARRILEKLAGGADAPETREAQTVLQRLNRR